MPDIPPDGWSVLTAIAIIWLASMLANWRP
jgi:hypothetical protein